MTRPTPTESPEIALLREVTTAVARGRDVAKLLEDVIDILEKRLGMLRGTVTLLEGDELHIVASARILNAEERALGRYRIGEGITGLVAKTGRTVVVPDVRRDPRFLNRTGARRPAEAVSFVCVPLIHLGQVVGTLSADREIRPDARPMQHDVALLEIVANAAAEAASSATSSAQIHFFIGISSCSAYFSTIIIHAAPRGINRRAGSVNETSCSHHKHHVRITIRRLDTVPRECYDSGR